MLIYSFSFWAVLQKCVYVPIHIHHVHFPYAKLNKLSKNSYMGFGLDVTWQHLQANTCSCKAHLHSFNFQSSMFQLSQPNTLCLFRPSELDGVICYLLGCFSGSLLLITLNNSNQLSKVVYLWRWLSPPPLLLYSLPPFFPPSFSIAHTSVGKNPSLSDSGTAVVIKSNKHDLSLFRLCSSKIASS